MPLTARGVVRKMRGGAQSHLLEADDGCFYIVKFQNNPQHRRILVNELVSYVFLQYLQICVPEINLIDVRPEFLREHPEVCITLGTKQLRVEPGWHFGSRYPGDPSRVPVYDFLPDALLEQVGNLNEFLGMLVFDKWMANADGRQSIFYRALVRDWTPVASALTSRPGFVVRMIDHGFVFNGPNWDFPDSPLQGLYARRSVYQGVRSMADFEPWLSQVTHFPEDVVDKAYRQVPPEWIEGEEDEFEGLLEKLLARRKRVEALIEDSRRSRVNPFPNWP